MVLVDTSVWIDHLRHGNARLAGLLRLGQVLIHPLVIGELACGNLENRQATLSWLGKLPRATPAAHEEVLHLVESGRLWGLGLGWVDAHLVASALLTRCVLWTLDRRLAQAAQRAGVTPPAV
jgi:hypothetical protein